MDFFGSGKMCTFTVLLIWKIVQKRYLSFIFYLEAKINSGLSNSNLNTKELTRSRVCSRSGGSPQVVRGTVNLVVLENAGISQLLGVRLNQTGIGHLLHVGRLGQFCAVFVDGQTLSYLRAEIVVGVQDDFAERVAHC